MFRIAGKLIARGACIRVCISGRAKRGAVLIYTVLRYRDAHKASGFHKLRHTNYTKIKFDTVAFEEML